MGQDSQHAWLGCVPYLHLTVGVSDVLGIHIIANKSSKPHTEKMSQEVWKNCSISPELPVEQLLPNFICCSQRIFRYPFIRSS